MTHDSSHLTVPLLLFQALLYYCKALTETNLELQKGACLALRSLQVSPSLRISQVLPLCANVGSLLSPLSI